MYEVASSFLVILAAVISGSLLASAVILAILLVSIGRLKKIDHPENYRNDTRATTRTRT